MLDVMKAEDDWTIVQPLSIPLFSENYSRHGKKSWRFIRSFFEAYTLENISKEPFHPLPEPSLPEELAP